MREVKRAMREWMEVEIRDSRIREAYFQGGKAMARVGRTNGECVFPVCASRWLVVERSKMECSRLGLE